VSFFLFLYETCLGKVLGGVPTVTEIGQLLQCFLQTDLLQGRPSTMQFQEKLPWFLKAVPSADCAKGGHGAYSTSLDLNGTSPRYIFGLLSLSLLCILCRCCYT
jgi:hypothetical protein